MCKPWPTSSGKDHVHFGRLILRSCSSGVFVWLQVAVNLSLRSLKSVSAQDHKARREIPQLQ